MIPSTQFGGFCLFIIVIDMLVTLPCSTLASLLDIAARFVSKNATLPILENVYIKGAGDTLTIRATDMEKYIELTYTTPIETDGVLTINAKTLYDFVKTLRDDTDVTLDIDESSHTLSLRAGSDKFTIRGIPGAEYVAVPSIESEVSIDLNVQHLIDGINHVSYAVVDKSFTPVLTGVLMRVKSYDGIPHLVFTGSDSFRLAEYKIPLDITTNDFFELIIPKLNIADIQKVIEYIDTNGGDTVHMTRGNNMASFSATVGDISVMMSSVLIKWSFPDYENESVIPTQYTTTLETSTADIASAIRKIAILTSSNNSFVQCAITPQTITCTSGTTDMGDATSQIAATTDGDDITFACNGKYILDFIRQISTETLSINIAGPMKPLVLKDANLPALTYIIRPLTTSATS